MNLNDMEETEKIFFQPGDLVTLNKNVTNKPVMYVLGKKTAVFRQINEDRGEEFLKGILCRWFTTTGELQEALFNTKDIKLVK